MTIIDLEIYEKENFEWHIHRYLAGESTKEDFEEDHQRQFYQKRLQSIGTMEES